MEEVLGSSDGVLVSILLLLNWASLLQASRVCKSWRSVIASPKFRAEWRNKHGTPKVLLLSAYNYDWQQHPRPQQLLIWSPSDRSSSPAPLPAWMKIPLPPGTFDIVASSHGLVAARHPSWSDDHTPGVEFTVGNPATNEWVRIPRLNNQVSGRLYCMTVDPASGEFGLLDWLNNRIYESRSRSWVGIKLAHAFSDQKVLDIARRRLVRLRDPLQDHPEWWSNVGCVGIACEHGGKHYMGQVALCLTTTNMFYQVWSVERSAKCREVASIGVDLSRKVVYADESMAMESQADGNLVCFTGQCRDLYVDVIPYGSPSRTLEPLPVAVYDIDKGEWFHVPPSKGLHHRRAVVYVPSLVRPSGCASSGAVEFGDGEFLWHKRKREEQPEMASIRKKRRNEMDEEDGEDIFFL